MSILSPVTPNTLHQGNLLNQYYYVWNSRSWVGNPISHSLTPLGSSKSEWVLSLLKLR